MAWGRRKPSTPLEHLAELKRRRADASAERRAEKERQRLEKAREIRNYVDGLISGLPSVDLRNFVHRRAHEATMGEHDWVKSAVLLKRGAHEAMQSVKLLCAIDRRMTKLGRCADGGNLNDRNLARLIAQMAGMIR